MTRSELIDVIEGCWIQFGCRTYVKGKAKITDMGLSALESARDILVKEKRIDAETGVPPDYPAGATGGWQNYPKRPNK
jgi:hypothetical protein